jgi:site-specific DNA-methyltransferase (adenine-specific)
MKPKSEVHLIDCMEFLGSVPDKFYSLACVDPEFGIGIGNSPRLVTDKGLKAKAWDNKPIGMDYFDQLFRVSEMQIIWGGNYYPLPANKHCIIWDKMQPETLSFGMFDYAWTSFDGANKIFRY